MVHRGCPDVVETLKWSVPHFENKGTLCAMAAFKEHCRFGFAKATLIKGAKTNDDGTGLGQYRFTSLAELPSDRVLLRMVKQAAALNEQGVKAPKQPPDRRSARTAVAPDDFVKALKRQKGALAAFEAMPPSHKREYIEWIADAKAEETRQRRMATAVGWIAEGKPRNWKYMGAK